MNGARNFVQLMPKVLRVEFEQRCRDAAYGQSGVLAEWLKANGVKTSRSAVSRYEQELKSRDGVTGSGGSLRAVATSGAGALDELYRKLGELDFEREQIIGMIRDLRAGIEVQTTP